MAWAGLLVSWVWGTKRRMADMGYIPMGSKTRIASDASRKLYITHIGRVDYRRPLSHEHGGDAVYIINICVLDLWRMALLSSDLPHEHKKLYDSCGISYTYEAFLSICDFKSHNTTHVESTQGAAPCLITDHFEHSARGGMHEYQRFHVDRYQWEAIPTPISHLSNILLDNSSTSRYITPQRLGSQRSYSTWSPIFLRHRCSITCTFFSLLLHLRHEIKLPRSGVWF